MNGAEHTPDEYQRVHEPRWHLSLEWVKCGVPMDENSRVLEVAARGRFTDLFEKKFNLTLDNTDGDVRLPWPVEQHGKYDVVLCMEVIEHLPDNVVPGASLDQMGTFYKTGVRNCLLNCFRVLKPGGHLFLTTPNTSSVECLAKWIDHVEPMIWNFHVREYSFKETVSLVIEPGFEIVKAQTEDPFQHLKNSITNQFQDSKDQGRQRHLNWLHDSIGMLGASKENRGDLTFILARKKG